MKHNGERQMKEKNVQNDVQKSFNIVLLRIIHFKKKEQVKMGERLDINLWFLLIYLNLKLFLCYRVFVPHLPGRY